MDGVILIEAVGTFVIVSDSSALELLPPQLLSAVLKSPETETVPSPPTQPKKERRVGPLFNFGNSLEGQSFSIFDIPQSSVCAATYQN